MPVEQLGRREFDIIFTISGCTAQYDEQVFYLPYAFRCLAVHPSEGEDFLADLVHFLSTNAESLRGDHLLDACLESVRSLFRAWTADFQVVHFDAAACRAKGWGLDHSDYIVNSQTVRELIDCLLRYQPNSDLAEELVNRWRRADRTEVDSACLLEFAKEERDAWDYYSRTYPGKDRENTPTRFVRSIREIVSDNIFLQAELDRIHDTVVKNEESPTYWPDLIAALGLAS